MIYFFKISVCYVLVMLTCCLIRPGNVLKRLLLQVNRSRFDYQTEMLSASLLFLYMPIFVDFLLICVVLFDVIDVS